MNKRLLMILAIFAGALLQQLLPAVYFFGGIKPPVLAALAVYYALRRTGREMWVMLFLAAILQDGLEFGKFGPALMTFPVFGLVANRIRNEIFADGPVTLVFFGGAMALFVTLITMLLYGLTGARPMYFGYTTLRLIGAVVLGGVTLPLVSVGMKKAEHALPKRRGYGWQ